MTKKIEKKSKEVMIDSYEIYGWQGPVNNVKSPLAPGLCQPLGRGAQGEEIRT